ncbi:MAG: hypothetical protein AAF235_04555, partial [Planctomycetota bacterium]
MSRVWVLLTFLVCVILAVSAARASRTALQTGDTGDIRQTEHLAAASSDGHGWIIIPLASTGESDVVGSGAAEGEPDELASDDDQTDEFTRDADGDRFMLLHVPPRSYAGIRGAEPGVIRPARRLRSEPLAIAAIGPRVYLFFPRVNQSDGVRVLSVLARPAGVAGMWYFEPRSRLDAHPPIPENLDVLRAWAVDGVLLAKTVDQDGTRGTLMLGTDDWEPVDSIDQNAEAGGDAPGRSFTEPDEARSVAWREVDGAIVPTASFAGAELVLEGVSLPVGTDVATIVVPEPRPRLVLTWEHVVEPSEVPGPVLSPTSAGRYDAAEFSLDTGELLYLGPVKTGSPLATGDLRLIATGLVVLMAVALALLLAPAADAG